MTGKMFDEEALVFELDIQDLDKPNPYKENVNEIIDNYLQNIKNLLEKQSKTNWVPERKKTFCICKTHDASFFWVLLYRKHRVIRTVLTLLQYSTLFKPQPHLNLMLISLSLLWYYLLKSF